MAGLLKQVGVVSYNLWLIPFKGGYNLGRVDRVCEKLAEAASSHRDCDLVIVCAQEAWAYRAGVFEPLLRLYAKFEAWLLSTF